MKRVKTLSVDNGRVSVSIKIMVSSNKYLTRDETDTAITKLTDKAMLALSEMPYSDFYLSKVKVK